MLKQGIRTRAASGPAAPAADTLAERAAATLQRAVISGELAPGSKLRIRELMRRFGIGATPLREGLSRLVTAGFVQAHSQRGFTVMPTSRADLNDITRTRILIEREALHLAMERGDDRWEAEIVAALYRLRKATSGGEDGRLETADDFDEVHRDFHTALIAACGSPRLLELHRVLFDQAFRYRQILKRTSQQQKMTSDEHQRLADAVIARDVNKATALLEKNLKSTLTVKLDGEALALGREGRRTRRGVS